MHTITPTPTTATVQQPKGPWIHRFLIRLLTICFAILILWILGFLVEDIESIPGPQYATIEKEYVDRQLLKKVAVIEDAMHTNERNIERQREEMQLVGDSSKNLQSTMNQLIELQRLAIQKSVTFSETEQTTLAGSLTHFLENQKRYQSYSAELSILTDRQLQLETEKSILDKQIEQQRLPAQAKFRELSDQHSMRLAYLQLLVLLPLLAIGAVLIIKQRSSIYFPFFLGYGIPILIKISLVIHEYFPSRYFKYVLTLSLTIAVAKLLIYFIKIVAFPKAQWLFKQYREAYESFLCPVCEYPIRTGPRKFLFWTRRTVNKIVLPNGNSEESVPYACPACGTMLFETCLKCQTIRHSLLPFCQHCGTEKH